MGFLGKRFQQYINESLDAGFIQDRLRKFEALKLEILDACEYCERAPTFYDMRWAYELWQGGDYGFLYKEFAAWLKHNGLDANFQHRDGEVRMVISPNGYTNFNEVAELDLTSWMEKLTQK